MRCRLYRHWAVFVLLLAALLPGFAQQRGQTDSLVVLMSSKSARMVDKEGDSYREVIGPARFFHNNTYLLCDTALWNVETRIIDAWGNVSIIQEETILKSDKLTYVIDENLAKFRGSLVQLEDKDHNMLRTHYLDYNTKDSVAVFSRGGSMRDKDGQIIESLNGTYDSKIKKFTFVNDVNMFTDSVFIKTNELIYESERNLANFGLNTNAWQEDNMLSSDSGWYDRAREIFFFNRDVHVMSSDQEGWCDSLYFFRNTSDVEMLGNAQVTDTTRNVFALAGRIHYMDSLSKVTLTRKPAVITETETETGAKDTVYLGADKLVYYTLPMCDIDSLVVVEANERLKMLEVDPVGTFRKKAAEEAAKAAEEAAKKDPNYRPPQGGPKSGGPKPGGQKPAGGQKDAPKPPVKPQVADSLSFVKDSLAQGLDSLALVSDSLAIVADTVEVLPPKDTTKIGFLEALRNVRIFRKDMQVVCDSLVYSDLDSLARMFIGPVIWQEKIRQYSADSISVAITQGGIDKASLMSNAFIAIQEDTAHYDQIKSTEMLAYFGDKGELTRFDALGDAFALFYIEENGTLATVNKANSKMLSATFADGDLQRVYYFETAKNDGFPVVQLARTERFLKGFEWQGDRRPADRTAVTPLSLRASQRKSYSARPRATYRQTNRYFPGYIDDIYRQIEVRDSLRAVRERERKIAEAEAKAAALSDSLFRMDSIAKADSVRLRTEALEKVQADSLKMAQDSIAAIDSLAAVDSLSIVEMPLTKQQEKEKLKAEKKAAKEAARKKRIEEKEKRWAELDRRDEQKKALKEQKKLDKLRKKKRKALNDMLRQAEKDAEVLEKFRLRYEKRSRRR